MKKIIFLDFDGVLNSTAYFNTLMDQTTGNWLININSSQNQLDRKAVALLNQVIEKTGAKIVVSSTWRVNNSIDTLRKFLANVGVVGEIIDVTPEYKFDPTASGGDPCFARSVEIADWLSKNPVDKFAIIDDSSHAGHGFEKEFVKTKFHSGMQIDHANKLIEILNNT